MIRGRTRLDSPEKPVNRSVAVPRKVVSSKNARSKSTAKTARKSTAAGRGSSKTTAKAGKARRRKKFTLTVTVRNIGNATTSGGTLRLTLPKRLERLAPKSCCTIGALAAGAVQTIRITLRANRRGRFRIVFAATNRDGGEPPPGSLRVRVR